MCYKACTPQDIAFLKSQVSSSIPGHPSVCDQEFRNIPIITAKNIHKDTINKLGSERFAIESSQKLVHFYSNDSIRLSQKSAHNHHAKKVRKNNSITSEIQSILWNQPHSTTDKHIPGKLSLGPIREPGYDPVRARFPCQK